MTIARLSAAVIAPRWSGDSAAAVVVGIEVHAQRPQLVCPWVFHGPLAAAIAAIQARLPRLEDPVILADLTDVGLGAAQTLGIPVCSVLEVSERSRQDDDHERVSHQDLWGAVVGAGSRLAVPLSISKAVIGLRMEGSTDPAIRALAVGCWWLSRGLGYEAAEPAPPPEHEVIRAEALSPERLELARDMAGVIDWTEDL